MEETVEYMERYIEEIDAEKSDFIFRESTGKEYIHGVDMENRMSVLYGFFNFFKYTRKKVVRDGKYGIYIKKLIPSLRRQLVYIKCPNNRAYSSF